MEGVATDEVCGCAIVTFEDAALPVCSRRRMSISLSSL